MEGKYMENTTANTETPTVSTTDLAQKFKITYKKCKKLIFWACIAIIFQMVIAAVLSSILNVIFGAVPALNAFSQSGSSTMLVTAISYLIANPLAAFICLKASKIGKTTAMFKGNTFNAFEAVCACFAMTGSTIVITLLSTLFSSLFAGSDEYLNGFIGGGLEGSAFDLAITILYVCILGPITEEILGRGAILRISSPVGKVCAMVLSSVLFGLMHGNFTQIVNATVMGFVLAYVAIKSNSVIVPCIMHIFNNSTSVILAAVAMDMTERQVIVLNIAFEAVVVVGGTLGLIYLIKKHGKITKNDKILVNEVVSEADVEEAKAVKKSLALKTVLTCPSFWIVFVCCNLLAIAIATGLVASA